MIQDVISELNRIKTAGLISDYAIGGAVAAQAYIETSSTEDIDVFVVLGGTGAHPLNPLAPIWADLVAHGAKVDGMYLVIGGWPVQLLPDGTPIYDDAINAAVDKDFGGVVGRIMRPEFLAGLALFAGRNKDYLRVEEFIRREKVDVKALMLLVERYGLQSSWKTFETKFLGSNA